MLLEWQSSIIANPVIYLPLCIKLFGTTLNFHIISASVARKTLSINTFNVPMTISIAFVMFLSCPTWKTFSIKFQASIRLPAWLSACCIATGRKQNSVLCLDQILLSEKFYFRSSWITLVGDGIKKDYDMI